MKFIEQLKETEESLKARDIVPGMRMFKGIKFGDVHLSVQASEFHYCTPRETIELDQYTSMEFALMVDGEFVRISDLFPFTDVFEEVEEYFDQVYAYAPVELIEHVYQKLVLITNGLADLHKLSIEYEEKLLEHYKLVARYVKHSKKKAINQRNIRYQETVLRVMRES